MMQTNSQWSCLVYTFTIFLIATNFVPHNSTNFPGNRNYGSNSNSVRPGHGINENQYRPQSRSQNHYPNTFNQKPDKTVYPWPFQHAVQNTNLQTSQSSNQWPMWNQGSNNNYPSILQSGNRWPTWNQGNNNNYPSTSQSGYQWHTWNQGSNTNFPSTLQSGNRWPTWNQGSNTNFPSILQSGNRWSTWNQGSNNNYPSTPQFGYQWHTWNQGSNTNFPSTLQSGNRRPTRNQGNGISYQTTFRRGNQWPILNPSDFRIYSETIYSYNRWQTWNPCNSSYHQNSQRCRQESTWNPGNNSRTTPQPRGNQWSVHPRTQQPTTTTEPPIERSELFDLIDFQNLPDSYKTAFMSVEELIKNNGMVSPPGPNSQNVVVVFDNRTHQIFDSSLEPIVSAILPSLVPGTWRSMTYIQGCCSALRYHAANETLVNINGQAKKIVHFSKYEPPMYQFIPHGLCAQTSYSTNGHCIQGTVTMSLLVYDLRFNPPISFDIFSIPSYCNCVQY